MYLGWYDDSKKVTDAKISDAVAAYLERFKVVPNVVLVNAESGASANVAGCAVRIETYIRKNNFWVGFEVNSGNAVLPDAKPAPQPQIEVESGDVAQMRLFEV